MHAWLEWARGPAFVFSIMFMILGLVRHAALMLFEMRRAMRRAGDRSLPYGTVLNATVKWLFPVETIKNRFLFSVTSMLFHAAIIIVPVFLGGHIALWARGLGVSWPAIPNVAADALTIAAVVAAAALVIQRAAARATRELSRFQDYALPLAVALPFASGFLAMHPSVNPFAHEATLFVHAMSANIVFILIPLTKLSHIVLIPGVQMVSEIAWHWPPDAGGKVGAALGKEGKRI